MKIDEEIQRNNPSLASFMSNELKDLEYNPILDDLSKIPTEEEIRSLTNEELDELLLDASVDDDITDPNEEDAKFVHDRYNIIKDLVMKERDKRNEIQAE